MEEKMPKDQEALLGESRESPPRANSSGFLAAAWRRKVLLLMGTFVGILLGAAYYASRVPVFSASAQVLVVKKRPEVLLVGVGDARVASTDDFMGTHLTLIRSPLVVGRAVMKGSFATLASFADKGDPTRSIIAALSVTRDTKDGGSGNVLVLSYRGPVPEDCLIVLRGVIESYQDFLNETYRTGSEDNTRIITQARDMLAKDLAHKEALHREIRQTTGLPWTGKDGPRSHSDPSGGLEEKRSALVLRRTELEGKSAKLAKALKDDDLAVLNDLIPRDPAKPALSELSRKLREQLERLRLEEEKLLEVCRLEHPKVIEVRLKIDRTLHLIEGGDKQAVPQEMTRVEKELLRDAGRAHFQTLKRDLRDTENSEAALRTLAAAARTEASKWADVATRETSLLDDIARTQQLHQGLIKRLQELDFVKDLGGYETQTISPPNSGGQVEPKPLPIFAVAGFLGILAGFCLVYVAERLDQRVCDPEEIPYHLGLPVLASIPLLNSNETALGKCAEITLAPVLVAHHQPRSGEAEAYRSLRLAVSSAASGQGHKIIQLTSPEQGEGKSTVAANLAISVAQAGKRVLLIDGDFHQPILHHLFGITANTGLATVLSRGATLEETILPTGVEGLWLLPCGPRPPNPADLFTRGSFQEILDRVRPDYDLVVIDTPPLLAVTDSGVIARKVDEVLLLVRLTQSHWRAAGIARELLETLRAKVLGIVVNGVDARAGYGRYAYYGKPAKDERRAMGEGKQEVRN
jgi:polysaccharide biosynthesis transport protein